MAVGFEFDIEGMKEITASLDKLGWKLEKKVIRGAVRSAMNPLVKRARETVPNLEGGLEASLGVKVKAYKRSGWMFGMVGPFSGKGNRRSHTPWGGSRMEIPYFYAHIVEGGSKPHTLKAGQQRVGAKLGVKRLVGGGRIQHPGTKPTHFLKRAFRGTKAQVQQRFVEMLRKGIDREAKKLAKA